MKISDIINFLYSQGDIFQFSGNKDVEINSFSTPNNPKNNSVIWVKHADDFDAKSLKNIKNILIVTDNLFEGENLNFIIGEHSKRLFFTILDKFFKITENNGISKNSTVLTKTIGKNISIGHNCYIGKYVTIKDEVKIGNNVSIEGPVLIGENTIIHSGVVIGTDGFGFFKDEQGMNKRVPHYGGVIIGKNAEIGSNTSVNRGTLNDTYIGNYVKIGSNQLIPHNVYIEDNCFVLGQMGGSCKIGTNSYIAPYSFIMNQITIGKNCMVNVNTVVREDVPEGYIVNEKRRIKFDYKLILNL